MITLINLSTKPAASIAEGEVTTVLGEADEGTRTHLALYEIDPHKMIAFTESAATQVVYILEGDGATVTHEAMGDSVEHAAQRRTGIYLEPGERATVESSEKPLKLLHLTVPKHTGKGGGDPSPAGYFFDETQLRSLVDAKDIRERTFWVNKETGLSGSWDLQLGRMQYAPGGYSPRHVHQTPEGGAIAPEHFYLIEEGTGEVKHDGGSISVGPGDLILIPAGEWHQLIASSSGLDYIEFQAPFDFATTMDHDPLGKNWYIKGSDDGTGQPELWVQS